jgi:hypothetical protein
VTDAAPYGSNIHVWFTPLLHAKTTSAAPSSPPSASVCLCRVRAVAGQRCTLTTHPPEWFGGRGLSECDVARRTPLRAAPPSRRMGARSRGASDASGRTALSPRSISAQDGERATFVVPALRRSIERPSPGPMGEHPMTGERAPAG